MKKGVLYLVLIILVCSIVYSQTTPTAPGTPGSTPTGPGSVGGSGPTGPDSIGGPSGPGSVGGPGTPGLPGTSTNTCYSGDGVCVSGCFPTDTDCFMTPGCFDFDEDDYGMGCPAGYDLDCNDNDFDVNPGAPEVCGDGVDNNCDDIDPSCSSGPFCGDGTLDAGEACDEGGLNSATGECSTTCTLTFCGDGIPQSPNGAGVSEACDDSNDATCTSSCVYTEPTCTLTDASWDDVSAVEKEVVDFSVDVSNCDGQTLTYSVFEEDDLSFDDPADSNPADTFIGAGTTTITGSWTAEWQCDGGLCAFGFLPSYYFIASVLGSDPAIEITSGLLTTTESDAVCGDGIPEGAEACDDSNTDSGDGCSDVCVVEYCGDGILQIGIGEACDDGDTDSGDGCSSLCVVEPPVPVCGNLIVEPPETCEDGNIVIGDGCDVCIATGPPVCGNDILDIGEECDDGILDGVACDSSCMIPDGLCLDLDGDGFDGESVECPTGPDCNDDDFAVKPGVPEICTDSIDNNCADGINGNTECPSTGGNTGGNVDTGGSTGSRSSGGGGGGGLAFCYNGRQDVRENGVDCGGICVKQCSTAVIPQETIDQNIIPTIPTIGKPPVSTDEDKSVVPVLIGGLLLLGGLGGVAYYYVHKKVISGAVGAAKVGSNAFEVAQRYVENYIKLGYNQKDISGQMMKSGWQQQDIDKVFANIK